MSSKGKSFSTRTHYIPYDLRTVTSACWECRILLDVTRKFPCRCHFPWKLPRAHYDPLRAPGFASIRSSLPKPDDTFQPCPSIEHGHLSQLKLARPAAKGIRLLGKIPQLWDEDRQLLIDWTGSLDVTNSGQNVSDGRFSWMRVIY